MKTCMRCVLPENFPGIRFDEDGVCNFCRDYKGCEYQEKRKLEYARKFDVLVSEYKGKTSYDALMCYSG